MLEIDDLRGIIEKSRNKVFATIHYNSRELSTLAEQVSEIFDSIYYEGLCSAIQLNIPLPEYHELRKIKTEFPEMQIIFQANQKVMENGRPDEIAEKIKIYGDLIDYVLIDPSGGRGAEFDITKSIEIYEALRARTNLTVGFAGGFTGLNTENRVMMISNTTNTRDFCIDAEGGLRDKLSDNYGDDILNIKKVRGYIRTASRILG